MSHSKRNTSRPVFTSHERALAKSDWATSSARLNRDSFLPFGSCGLCLGIAREPVACLRGDIFCRECALANVLAQKKEMKRADRARREAKQEAEQARAMEDDEERDRAIRDFELTQAGLSSANKRSKSAPKSTPNVQDEPSSALVLVGWKRKFALDEDQVSHIAREDKTRARKAIEEEKAAKPTLPSFWTPSLTPDVQDSKLPPASTKDKIIPICPSSPAGDVHPISMQGLVTVHFNEDVGEPNETNRYTCPSCLKTLSNSSKPVMAEQCGHVICMSCVKYLMPPATKSTSPSGAPMSCYVCDAPVAPKKPSKRAGANTSLPTGFVALRSEGTGFSARGSNTIEKSSIAFQC